MGISRMSDNHIMVRPTLIVGLGGTGVSVCGWLERYILDILDGVPPFIRFLKLDTDAVEEGGPPNTGQSDFINLFHHIDIGEVVRDYAAHPEFHPHLDWFKDLNLDAAFADYGCQGIPRLGRLVFVELRETVIHKAVSARFSDLRASAQRAMDNGLEQFKIAPGGAPAVHIISSVCGGTGAGLLIDMAYNLRQWSKESFPRAAEIVGHLMLPEAFSVQAGLQSKLRAVAGATLEQIEFLSDPRRKDITVRYREPGEKIVFDRLTSPFNFLYLLNGQGDVGSGNRKHLMKMMARAIRAMVLEPTSQQVASDANNKLADVLGLRDPANGRRRCFASYGLWYGTPGHHHRDVESWIRSRLADIGHGSGAESAAYRTEIQKELRGQVEVKNRAAQIGLPPAKQFRWQIPDNASGTAVVTDILNHVAGHVTSVLEPVARNAAQAVFAPDQPVVPILKSLAEMIERDVFEAAALKPLSCVRTCLLAWMERIEQWLSEGPGSAAPTAPAVKEAILRNAREKLAELTEQLHADLLTPEAIDPAMGECIDRHWGELVAACLGDNLRGAMAQTLSVLRLWQQALDAVVELAGSGRWRPAAGSSRSPGAGPAPDGQDGDFFSTPLYASTDPTEGAAGILVKSFRQNLLRPILRNVVFPLAREKPLNVDMDSIRKRFLEELDGLRGKMQQFLNDVEADNQTIFHENVPPNSEVTVHRYYPPVSDVYRFAAPKIDLDRANIYAKPLDVAIAQHTSKCCVPALLQHDLGPAFREAHVTEEYEKDARVWFQLLRLHYGFSIEAISTYREYVVATDDYIFRRGFAYPSIWLDGRWYQACCRARQDWRNEREDAQGGKHLERTKYDAIAAVVYEIHGSVEEGFKWLWKGVLRPGRTSEVPLETIDGLKQMERDACALLDGIDAGNPRTALAGLRKCMERLGDFFQAEKGILAQELPQENRMALAGILDRCRRQVDELVTNLDQR